MCQELNATQISKILYEFDPMGTCCKENDCFDEYDSIARAICQKLANGHPVREAVSETLIDWFEVGSIEPSSLASIVQALQTDSHG